MYVLRAPGWGVDAVNEGVKKNRENFLPIALKPP